MPVLQILVIAYLILSACTITIEVALYYNDDFRQNFISKGFAYNREVQNVEAQVLGYERYITRTPRGEPPEGNIDYAIEYRINGKQYLGEYRAMDSITLADPEPKKTLPKSVTIQVDKNSPQFFSHINTIYSHNYFGVSKMWWIIIPLLLFVLIFNHQEFEFKNINNPKGYLMILTATIISLLILFASISTVRDLTLPSPAKDITGFEVIPRFTLAPNGQKQNQVHFQINVHDSYEARFKELILHGLGNKNIKRIYTHSTTAELKEIPFEDKGGTIKMRKEYSDTFYAFSDDKKYILRLSLLKKDFEYKQ
jgi:hypothetical protein